MKNHTHRKHLKGFTLIELLVVITIIALLVSILMPALNKAKQQAYAVNCMANEKSIGQGMMQYLAEHDDTYPPSYVYPNERWDNINMKDRGTWSKSKQPNLGEIVDGSINGYIHWSWFLLGKGGSVDPKSFQCPTMPTGGAPATNPAPEDAMDGQYIQDSNLIDRQAPRMAYALNIALCPRNKFNNQSGMRSFQLVKSNKVKGNGETILATEGPKFWKAWGYPLSAGSTSSETFVKSHRPITPFTPLGQSTTTEDAILNNSLTNQYVCYTTDGNESNNFGLWNINQQLENEGANINFDTNSLNAVGRHHPGNMKSQNSELGGTTNFLFADGHVSRMYIMETMEKMLWGKRFYSVTGDNTVVYTTMAAWTNN